MNNKQRDIIEKHFNLYEYEENYDIETWTDGGVDMIINIDNDENIVKALKDYYDSFDMDEEIEMYRQSQDYKDHFTIMQSVKDFTDWLEFIENVIKELEDAE